jgi:hypothetical protein
MIQSSRSGTLTEIPAVVDKMGIPAELSSLFDLHPPLLDHGADKCATRIWFFVRAAQPR